MADKAAHSAAGDNPTPPWLLKAKLEVKKDIGSGECSTAVPHRLCDLCIDAVTIFTQGGFWEEDARIPWREPADGKPELDHDSLYSTRPHLQKPEVTHHDNPQRLRESADRGCHLCSLLLATFEAQHPAVHSSQLRLVSDATRRKRTNGCQQIRIWSEPTSESNVKSNRAVLMHRHPHPLTRDTFSAGRNSLLADTQEYRFRWCKSTYDQVGIHMINGWIQRCIEDHDTCRLNYSASRPERVLDLNAFPDSEDLRLIQTDKARVHAWATLSYRWGAFNPLTLGTHNYDALKARIAYDSVPRTIQEAVQVCRALNMRYLWVDALCIMQDGGKDFAIEVSKMGAIYAGSRFTIAAAASDNSNSGCFGNRFPLRCEDCVLLGSDNIHWIFGRDDGCGLQTHQDRIQTTPLNRRGWVFQERMMSPRTIYLTPSDLFFECRETFVCHGCAASGFAKGSKDNQSRVSSGKRAFTALHTLLDQTQYHSSFRKIWVRTISDYSLTELTNIDDKLSALAGIAEMAQSTLQCQASYGLWLDFFISELQWFTYGVVLAELREQVPSWSWVRASDTSYRSIFVGESESEKREWCATVIRAPSATPFAQLSSLHKQMTPRQVSFSIRGRIETFFPVPVRQKSAGWSFVRGDWTMVPTKHAASDILETYVEPFWAAYLAHDKTDLAQRTRERFGCRLWPEYRPDEAPLQMQAVTCLLLQRTHLQHYTLDSGIALEQLDATKNVYRRVGFFAQEFQSLHLQHHKSLEQDCTHSLGCSISRRMFEEEDGPTTELEIV